MQLNKHTPEHDAQPTMKLMLTASRKPGYFYWNVFLVMVPFLSTSLFHPCFSSLPQFPGQFTIPCPLIPSLSGRLSQVSLATYPKFRWPLIPSFSGRLSLVYLATFRHFLYSRVPLFRGNKTLVCQISRLQKSLFIISNI